MITMNDTRLLNIIKKYSTPSYVFDACEVRERAEKIRSLIGGRLCFSIKANPFLIPALMDTVNCFEVCSPGELYICEHLKVPGSMIVYSGVHKETEDTAEAIRYGAGVLTAESVRQYELICEAAASEAAGSPVNVILRLTSESQFGMSLEDIEKILKHHSGDTGSSAVRITGLHYFAGTQRLRLDHQRKELERLRELFEMLKNKYGLPLSMLEYGPGLGYPYFESDDLSDTLAPAKELSSDLKAASKWCDLTVEMGRFIASSCGYYLTSIADIKTSSDKNWIIADGGIHHLNYFGQRMGLKFPVIKMLHTSHSGDDSLSYDNLGSISTVSSDSRTLSDKEEISPSDTKPYDICGSLCTTNDVLVRGYGLKDPKIGDVLIFCHAGAYSVTESMQLFLSRTMPGVIIADETGETMVRGPIDTWKMNCCLYDK